MQYTLYISLSRFSLILWTILQGCMKFLIPPTGGGVKFITSVGEEYQVVKRGNENHGLWGKSIVEKRLRGSNIICSIILRLLGRISSGIKGKGTDISGRKSRFKKIGFGEEYQKLKTRPWINVNISKFLIVVGERTFICIFCRVHK